MLAASTSVCSTGCFMQIWVVNSTINSRGFRTSVHFSLFYRVDSVSDHCMMFPTCLKLESSWERSSLERRSMWVWTMSNLLRTLFPRKLAVGEWFINVSKCQFAKTSLSFLGHFITPEGITPMPDKVEAITKLAQPTTTKELQVFMDIPWATNMGHESGH